MCSASTNSVCINTDFMPPYEFHSILKELIGICAYTFHMYHTVHICSYVSYIHHIQRRADTLYNLIIVCARVLQKNVEGSHDNHHHSCSSAVNLMSCWQLSCQFMFRVVTHVRIYVHTVYVKSYDKLHLQSISYALGCTTYQDGVETGPI